MPIDWTKPIETVKGYPARLLSTDVRSCGELFAAVQVEYLNCSEIKYYKLDGLCTPEIRNRKTKREGWINIYRDDRTGEVIYKTKEDAEGSSTFKITTIKIEWEE